MGFVSFQAFNRILTKIGIKIRFEQLDALLKFLDVYDQRSDKLYYYKIVESVFRKTIPNRNEREKPPPTVTDYVLRI